MSGQEPRQERSEWTVMGEIYLKKPPLYNWLIALAAGNRFDAADTVQARWVTIGALVLIGLLLWRLGAAGPRVGPNLLPAVMFLTMAVVILLFGGLVGAIALPAIAGLLIVVGFGTLKPEQEEMV